jgi:hypothetical protein
MWGDGDEGGTAGVVLDVAAAVVDDDVEGVVGGEGGELEACGPSDLYEALSCNGALWEPVLAVAAGN